MANRKRNSPIRRAGSTVALRMRYWRGARYSMTAVGAHLLYDEGFLGE
jgi:hypothetical protein